MLILFLCCTHKKAISFWLLCGGGVDAEEAAVPRTVNEVKRKEKEKQDEQKKKENVKEKLRKNAVERQNELNSLANTKKHV